ncbi:RagB/SusD family nutrient uptake outer membrane protein [Flavivirga rizhaonensis]|uniref:RagB/SusD family nutrient uptake outer membrane protein n=1 Tax=Flavivirga rizhaonensis TaxID=2559571 RepID=A0A4S1E297_9FLAO|nr:RagB/SusD family nutrient uptake outer membrane protein [Flavivirga rizhaonensis]TGV04737.1 RagB/SusD family nutrient uptake outer membrane protein [Flavivirga rizhaonensis]
MKTLIKLKKLTLPSIVILIVMVSCNDDYLTEVPKDFLAPDNTFVNKEGFEAALTALYSSGRGTHMSGDGIGEKVYEVLFGQGADIGYHIDKKSFVTDYSTINSNTGSIRQFWQKFYDIVKDANVIITRADSENAKWDSEEEKNEVVAQAKFFRAYAYRLLVWLYGDVPIIREELTAPKLDFTRDPVSEVISFILSDLEFASEHLPQANPDGARLSKAAADYLLAETYIVTQQWDMAIAAADRILDDPQYDLMRERFGSMTDKPGDPYWDLFRYGNQDRSSGNKENIFAWQYEFNVDGGSRNRVERAWGPFLERLKTPDNKQAILKDEFLGRPVCFIRITPWVETGMWDDFDNDMRNSEYNVKRDFYINNPESANFGELIVPTAANYARNMYPYFQKFTMPHGHPQGYDTSGTIYTDWYVFRVAGVYLLKAEAYLGKGDLVSAAANINVIRERANASLVAPGDVTIDYILDERARELLGEEDRRVSLNRTGKLVERTLLHNPVSGPTIQDFNALLPIPQVEIDANKEAELKQNPGY